MKARNGEVGLKADAIFSPLVEDLHSARNARVRFPFISFLNLRPRWKLPRADKGGRECSRWMNVQEVEVHLGAKPSGCLAGATDRSKWPNETREREREREGKTKMMAEGLQTIERVDASKYTLQEFVFEIRLDDKR